MSNISIDELRKSDWVVLNFLARLPEQETSSFSYCHEAIFVPSWYLFCFLQVKDCFKESQRLSEPHDWQ